MASVRMEKGFVTRIGETGEEVGCIPRWTRKALYDGPPETMTGTLTFALDAEGEEDAVEAALDELQALAEQLRQDAWREESSPMLSHSTRVQQKAAAARAQHAKDLAELDRLREEQEVSGMSQEAYLWKLEAEKLETELASVCNCLRAKTLTITNTGDGYRFDQSDGKSWWVATNCAFKGGLSTFLPGEYVRVPDAEGERDASPEPKAKVVRIRLLAGKWRIADGELYYCECGHYLGNDAGHIPSPTCPNCELPIDWSDLPGGDDE